MATADTPTENPTAASPAAELEARTYEIIRKRLNASGQGLRERLAKLNEARKEVFGSIETRLLGTERVTTENNCVPRDMESIGGRFLFGYNVHIGLRSETKLSDVFAAYEFRDGEFHPQPLDTIADEQFEKDFHDLYKYYRDTRFANFARRGPHLFMVFTVGGGAANVKTFKWAVAGDRLHYLDNRSDHEFGFPPQHEFDWITATRDMHRSGVHPHVSIEDRVFVETVGGDLTIKIENNTDSGEGIYSERVENPDQTLDDADIRYAVVGNLIVLKIRPYQEKQYRHIVYNEKIKQARRIDAVADACLLLPDDHGLIFPNGYYLQTGETKTFETGVGETVFFKQIRSPNGEDFLYVFYNRTSGTYVMLSYNLIAQEVSTPNICNGYALFGDGKMITFRHHDDPQKHHAIQIWQTPYVGLDYRPEKQTDSLLYKIGNRDLVRAMAECHEVLNLLGKEDTYANLYLDLVRATTDILDTYFWIDSDEAFHLNEVLAEIRDTAQNAISEYEKVLRVRRSTREQIAGVTEQTQKVISEIHAERFEEIGGFVRCLAELRRVRGEIIALRELRYADQEAIDRLEEDVREHNERLAARCVEFLLEPDSLIPSEHKIEAEQALIPQLGKAAQAKELGERIGAAAAELEMLIEIVSNLKIEDATHRTEIIDNISAIFSRVNQARAALKNKTRELMAAEGAAEFHSQLKLLNQAVVNYLDICDTAERCEEYLTKVMIQLEEMEGRFAEFDEFIEQLAEKRDEIYNAFEARRLQLVETRNRRADALVKSAERILKGCRARVESFETAGEINGYFASDLMVEKVRDIVRELSELGDSVRVDDIQSRLKTIKEDAVRQLKDRQELYVDGKNVIQLGRHKFSVNTQELDLTTVIRDGQMCFHLSGTNFFQPVDDAELDACRTAWDQEVVSENDAVYRAEYLAYLMLGSLGKVDLPQPGELAQQSEEQVLALVQRFMGPRYREGYVKGVHDADAAKILRALVDLKIHIGPLHFRSQARALAWLFWLHWADKRRKPLLTARLEGFGKIRHLFPEVKTQEQCVALLRGKLTEFVSEHRLALSFLGDGESEFSSPAKAHVGPSAEANGRDEASGAALTASGLRLLGEAAEYLFQAISHAEGFVISREASDLFHELKSYVDTKGHADELAASLDDVKKDLLQSFSLARDWMLAFIDSHDGSEQSQYAEEAALLLLEKDFDESRVVHTPVTRDLEGMAGSHPVIEQGRCHLHYNEFSERLADFAAVAVPRFERYTHRKHELVEGFRESLRLDEFRPRVLTSFVRNKLLDKVYLPLVGDNLAKQIGVAGEAKRTDRMGLLLIVSPPGYGKTTLMEYIANRLGLVFMKVNGPAIGHQVTSLDPQEAPNASAREEIEKLNLALEMGDNIMLYLDDIQHCNPELLQKFISLCDAQRKIEGVYRGRTRTYDLRGRKVCVVMAGNPYTESGEKFKIPDMLANRADTYNLGEIIGDNREVFEMSYLENALTSNPTLANLATKSQQDVYAVIKMAETGEQEGIELESNVSLDELSEYVETMKKLMRVRDVVLTVNREYIRSAAQADDYRTEPAFKLQGSYRNMNRIAERVSPIMNDRELEQAIYSAYENDAQTLTSGAEANLLKFKELAGSLSPAEAERWEEIKQTFQRNQKLRGIDAGDRLGQVIAQLNLFSEGLGAIRETLDAGISQVREANGKSQIQLSPETVQTLRELISQWTPAASPELEEPEPPRIHVVNKVPRVILGVIREQFNLMQTWLKPLLEASQTQREDISQLKSQLDLALANYRELLSEMEEDR